MSSPNANRTYDSLHMGRSSIDLYSNDVGAPFVDITSFAAYVSGSPTNISGGERVYFWLGARFVRTGSVSAPKRPPPPGRLRSQFGYGPEVELHPGERRLGLKTAY